MPYSQAFKSSALNQFPLIAANGETFLSEDGTKDMSYVFPSVSLGLRRWMTCVSSGRASKTST